MSGWSKEEWEEFCAGLGVDASKAIKAGEINLGTTKKTQREPAKTKRNPAPGIPHAKREQDPHLALEPPVARTQPLVEDSGRSPGVHIIIRGLRLRFLDPDNFVAGCKALVDGLVRAGITPDDSKKAIDAGELQIDYEQQLVTSYTKEATEIEIIWSTDS